MIPPLSSLDLRAVTDTLRRWMAGLDAWARSLGTASALNADADAALTANSDQVLPTQKAVKAYADAITASVGAIDEKADKSVSVTGTGLATGGGTLEANREIDVAAATDDEAIAGAATDSAITPAALKAVIDHVLGQTGEGSDTLGHLFLGGTLVNQGNGPYWAHVRTSDEVLFILVTNDSYLRAYDISTPSSPVLLGSVQVNSPAGGEAFFAIHGNYAYVTNQASMTLRVVDASDPASMSVIGTLIYDATGGSGGGRCDITPDGNYLCVGGAESGGSHANKAIVIDVSTPSSPTVAGRTAAIGATHRGVACISNTVFAFSSRDNWTVYVVDLSMPSAPVQIGSYLTPLGNTTTPMTYDASTATLYVGNYGVGYLFALDMTTPTSPSLRSAVAIPIGAEQIAITDTGRALVACRASNQLAEIDCSDPDALTSLEVMTFAGTVTPGVAYYGGIAYVTCAGDTNNGKIYVVAVDPDLATVLAIIQASVASLEARAAGLVANTFAGKQTITPQAALSLTHDSASVTFGTTSPDTLSRSAAALFTWAVRLVLSGVDVITAGSAFRTKTSPSNTNYVFSLDADGNMVWGSGSAVGDCRLTRSGAGILSLILGDFRIAQAGKGLRVAEGANCKQGITTLVGGTVTVANTSVTANSKIHTSRKTGSGVRGHLEWSVIAGVSFTITSVDSAGALVADNSTVTYQIFEPA